MRWWLPDYEPSDHEQAISSLFSPHVVRDRRQSISADRTLILCFTNRSGSNFLASALASTGGVGLSREFLNHPVVRRRSERLGIGHFDDYLCQLAEEFSKEGWLTVKAGLKQLYYLAKLELLETLLPKPVFVLVNREDVVAQAVSWLVAIQSGQWTSSHQVEDREPVYDFGAIDQRVDAILAENAAFIGFLARNGAETHHVRYEDLVRRPGEVVGNLATALDFSQTEYRPGRIRTEKQRSTFNLNWESRVPRRSEEQLNIEPQDHEMCEGHAAQIDRLLAENARLRDAARGTVDPRLFGGMVRRPHVIRRMGRKVIPRRFHPMISRVLRTFRR